MSHVSSAPILIPDDKFHLDCLEEALQEINPGMQLHRGKTTWKYWGSWANDYGQEDAAYKRFKIDPKNYGTGVHAISVPGTEWEIGLMRPEGSKDLALVFDFYGGRGRVIKDLVGDQCAKLVQSYNRIVAVKSAQRNYPTTKGWMHTTKTLPNGDVQLVMRQY